MPSCKRHDGTWIPRCWIDYQRLLRFLRIQPSIGTPFSNIRELSKLRVTVTYRQGTLLDLHRCLYSGLPCIVSVRTGQLPYWDNIDTQHAVVVVGMDKQSIYLNDPEFPNAPIKVGFGDFDLAWFEQGEYYAILAP